MARPRKDIPQQEFESLCALQCTREEVCAFFHISEKTLEAWCKRTYHQSFSPVFQEKRLAGKVSLRRMQFRLAAKSSAMGIWLGKQYLDQREPDQHPVDPVAEDDGFLEALQGEAEKVWEE